MKLFRTTISRDIATRTFFLAASLSLFGLPGTVLGAPGTSGASKPVFRDAASQAKEFIVYYHSIRLDAEQQKIYEAALGSVPAPCCSDYPILTCCCPCNAAKATWGLSRYLIAKLGYSAPQVKDTVTQWLRFINPRGFTGNACFAAGCKRPFAENGCGGMDETSLITVKGS
jgi:hypothetical protein